MQQEKITKLEDTIADLKKFRGHLAVQIQQGTFATISCENLQEGVRHVDNVIMVLERMLSFLKRKILEGIASIDFKKIEDVETLMFAIDRQALLFLLTLVLSDWMNKNKIDRAEHFGHLVD